jgi:hypothetical protein
MNCPTCNTPIPPDLLAREFASRGGKAGRGEAKARSSELARKAGQARAKKAGQKLRE